MSRQLEEIERFIVARILAGEFAVGSSLPGERELAGRLGVTRTNIRIVLQKMAAAGWLRVAERHATVVNDFWQTGDLQVLAAIVQHAQAGALGALSFIGELLEVRLGMAPLYARAAVERQPQEIADLLDAAHERMLPEELAAFNWRLHLTLARHSGNRVYPLLLNSFAVLGQKMGQVYFRYPACRQATGRFYSDLKDAARRCDGQAAYSCTERAMRESIQLWQHCREDLQRAGWEEVADYGAPLERLG